MFFLIGTLLMSAMDIIAEGSSRFPHLSRLPKASVLRQKCLACPNRWLFKGAVQTACEGLEDALSYAAGANIHLNKRPHGSNIRPGADINEDYRYMNSILLDKHYPTWEDDTRWGMNITEAEWQKLHFSEQLKMEKLHRWRISRERHAFYTLRLIIFTEQNRLDMIENQKKLEAPFETDSNPEQETENTDNSSPSVE